MGCGFGRGFVVVIDNFCVRVLLGEELMLWKVMGGVIAFLSFMYLAWFVLSHVGIDSVVAVPYSFFMAAVMFAHALFFRWGVLCWLLPDFKK